MRTRSRLIDDLLALRESATPGAARILSFIDDGGIEETLTHHELAIRASQATGALAALGARENDLVLLALPGSATYASLLLGCRLLGALPCTAPVPGHRFGADGVQTVEVACRLYSPRVLFTTDAAAERLRARLAGLPTRVLDLSTFAQACAAGGKPVIAQRTLDDPHHAQLTSGSLAHPRAAVLSHRAVADNAHGIATSLGYDAERGAAMVSWLPLHHDMGLMSLLTNVHTQARLQILQPASFLRNPLGWLKRIATFGATTSAAPTFALRYCVRRFKADAMQGVDLACWRNFVIGAERVDEATVTDFARTFAPYGMHGTVIQPCYGMAESTLAVTMQDAGRTPPGPSLHHVMPSRRPTGASTASPAAAGRAPTETHLSVGRPIPGMECKILDERGRLLGDHAAGEIYIRGTSVMLGYLPAEGKDATHPLDAEGWLATGDIGYLASGHLHILGRKKEIIILRGTNHFPHEIEEAVARHPAIHRDACAAVGVYDPQQATENLVLLAEARPGHAAGPLRTELQATLQREIGHRAHDIVLVEPGSLPRTTSGKLQRLLSRSMYLEGRFRLEGDPPPGSPSDPPRSGDPTRP